ncbi:MAG TPA: nitrous oxide reductase accessory protein NosL [Geobacteraceae bacterium]|nr:nitrous oxide reductase accessory protein NosL [Geobacteraceae bacterium]
MPTERVSPMTACRNTARAFLCVLFLAASTLAADPAAAPAPSAKDKCPVCGMFVAKYPDWLASSRLKDGTTYFFDGPRDMFSHYLDLPRYARGKQQADITSLAVKEYYSLKTIDARNAFFVIGSDVYGPMGAELVPFTTKKDATAFMADHRGKRIVRFSDVTPQLLKSLK